jgi:hypothetical protein
VLGTVALTGVLDVEGVNVLVITLCEVTVIVEVVVYDVV